jgi:hypothetical protein
MPAEYGICCGSLQFFALVSSPMRNHDISGSLHCHFMSSPIEKTQRLQPFQVFTFILSQTEETLHEGLEK